MRRTIALTAAWLVAVTAGAVLGIAALGALGSGGSADAPLSQRDVEDQLARGTSQPAATPAAPPSGTGTPGVRGYISNAGGTLWASCLGGLVTLSAVTPNQGYRIDNKQLGPATTARVTFKLDVEHGHAAEYRVSVICADGAPQSRLETDD